MVVSPFLSILFLRQPSRPIAELHFELDADADIALPLLDQEIARPVTP
jgi:hypothetical protein